VGLAYLKYVKRWNVRIKFIHGENMRIVIKLILASIFILLTACATNKPFTYNPEYSKALNVVKAAKMDYGLKDVEIPKDTVFDIRDTKTFGVAYGLAGYNSPMPGMSASSTAGLNILAWALQPKSPSARNSIIAWMPESIGGKTKEEALDKMADLIIEATEKAAMDLSFAPTTFVAKKGTDKRGFAISLTDNESENCQVSKKAKDTVSDCYIAYKVRYPHKIEKTEEYIGSGSAWFFDPVERKYTAMIFKDKKDYQYNQLELLINVSKNLPHWVYIYLAPGEVQITKDRKLHVPLIINKGELLYFIKV